MKKQCTLKAIAVLLILSICMSIFPSSVFAVSYLSENEKVATTDELYISDVVGENIDGVLTEADVPEIVGYQEAVAKDHIARLYEDEGSDLNKIVFLNADGSKTMYLFGFPVKYINEAGSVQDIRLEIADNTAKSGEFKTAANDAITSFPAKFTDGISLKGNETEIRLAPVLPTINSGEQTMATNGLTATVVANATAQRVDKNTIKYQYDSKTTIEYSLTYTGFKEDIVVHEYTGQTTYPFRLYTNGLELEKIEGSYYLINENGDIKAAIGDIIVFTADNRNNTFGEIIPTTVIENEEYLLNIVVDADYLADPNTIYPIRIDPTIEVNYDEDGASAIEDITISTNTNFAGSHTSLYVGRRSAEGVARALIRFPGLSLSGLTRTAITNASLRVRDLMCESEQMNIYCHAFTGNVWDANSATWNSVNPDSYSASPISTVAMSWSIGNALDPIHWYAFNITEAVRGWTDNTYAQNKGLILKMDSTTESGSTIKNRTFGSYNRASYKPSLTVTYTDGTGGGDAFTDASTISLGTSKYITTTIKQEQRYFKFTPTETAEYVIMSNNYTGDPKVWLYGSGGSSITNQDDVSYPSNKNFWLKYTLQANTTYYIGAGHAGSNVGGYYFMILKSANLANGFYHIRNHYSSKRLDICGPGEQIYVHQWTAHTGEQEKWLIQGHIENNTIAYYTIRSQYGENKYIGVSSTNTGENNIQLFDSIGDNAKWNIYSTPAGSYYLEPITAKGRSIYAADTGTGTKMQLSWVMPVSSKTKWYMDAYTYSDVNLTFSAFDVGDSSEDEVAIVKQWMESFGYTDIGTYNNADEKVLAESIKDIGRYSDVVYINGHGGRYANMKVKYGAEYDIDGDGQPDDESNIISYLCADDSVNPGNNISRIGIGADWITGSTTKTESYWDRGTKWGIIAQCAQLDYSTNAPDALKHWKDTYYSAQVWARTMLGVSERIHGYVGYYNVAPGGSTHTTRLTNFFSRVNEDNYIVNAWAQAHTALIGSSDWAAIYHSANATDSFQSMTASTEAGSAYTIYYVARDASVRVLPLNSTSGNLELTDSLLQNNTVAMPLFTNNTSTEGNALSTEALYDKLYNILQPSDNSILNVEDNGRITYIAGNKDWGGSLQRCTLSNSEAVSIAEQQLAAMGLLPTDDYNVTVSKIQRQKLNLNGEMVYLPETIQYVVSFYRTHNGVEVLSDQEDGIIVCIDGSGLTELRYLWRKMDTVTCSQMNTSEVISIEQAQTAYQAAVDAEKQIIAMNDTSSFAKTVYLQIGNEVRPAYSFSTDEGYANCIFVDMLTGEVINLS